MGVLTPMTDGIWNLLFVTTGVIIPTMYSAENSFFVTGCTHTHNIWCVRLLAFWQKVYTHPRCTMCKVCSLWSLGVLTPTTYWDNTQLSEAVTWYTILTSQGLCCSKEEKRPENHRIKTMFNNITICDRLERVQANYMAERINANKEVLPPS